ncbi:tetraacyldisaccharide 4'-kinase [Rheinheimera sp. UJ51]|uniref:tetraacyldisaccharide 4'-kinase n=1 Tax=Rheinheimera sp. UJ51 TaxID=2892446 RepID=UPI001E553220|nr:tetraacyldisaccharide 4'-kinase [Rheinheimera sp. UJ51]MCC5450123.1 tetraacyldisaccharide 4'-kinase [Rheinheimera sp. UJ51]
MTALERGWYQGRWWCYLLAPFSLLFWLLSILRRALFRLGIKRHYRLPVPVIVVGNITVGGTGKTPFTLWLCQLLREQGFTPGIISRGYGVKLTAPRLVTANCMANQVGDEPLLLAQRSGCPVVVFPDRVSAGQHLLSRCPDVDIIISDDGLQHYRLARDLEIVLIDGQRVLGNGWLLPAGPLRELPSRLASVDFTVANSGPLDGVDGHMTLAVVAARPLLAEQPALAVSTPVQLVAAIGNPARFARSAQEAGFNIAGQHFFADHHPFSPDDFTDLTLPLLMTEKDAVKCRSFAKSGWYYLAVQARLDPQFTEQLSKKLNLLRSQYGHESGID